MSPETFTDYLDLLDWVFEQFAPNAVAAKCLWAYHRPLEVMEALTSDRAFRRVRNGTASAHERRRAEDALFLRCVHLATQYRLPIKMHLGYLAGTGHLRADDLSRHVAALASLAERFPATQFVLMHMAWPHQEEAIALAKHMPNVVVDLCWSWIVSPVSTVEFVTRFLKAAPASKLMCFGGDSKAVELTVGHAELARRGLALSLERLVGEDWLTDSQALDLVPRLMYGNAARVFGYAPSDELPSHPAVHA